MSRKAREGQIFIDIHLDEYGMYRGRVCDTSGWMEYLLADRNKNKVELEAETKACMRQGKLKVEDEVCYEIKKSY